MSFSFPWLSVTLAQAGPAALKTVGQVAVKTNQAFGDLLSQITQSSDNGPSDQNLSTIPSDVPLDANSESSKRLNLLELQDALHKWLDATCEKLSIEREPGKLSLEVDKSGEILVQGPEPLRGELENHLRQATSLRESFLALAMEAESSLQWSAGSPSLPVESMSTDNFTLRL